MLKSHALVSSSKTDFETIIDFETIKIDFETIFDFETTIDFDSKLGKPEVH